MGSDRLAALVTQWRQDAEELRRLSAKHGPLGDEVLNVLAHENDQHADQLEAAILAPPEPQWQPIETAPKDGAAVLTVVAGKIPFVAWWCGGNEYGGFWRGDAGYRVYPSHWQPLPAPPEPAPQP